MSLVYSKTLASLSVQSPEVMCIFTRVLQFHRAAPVETAHKSLRSIRAGGTYLAKEFQLRLGPL